MEMANRFRDYILVGNFDDFVPGMSIRDLLYQLMGVPLVDIEESRNLAFSRETNRPISMSNAQVSRRSQS